VTSRCGGGKHATQGRTDRKAGGTRPGGPDLAAVKTVIAADIKAEEALERDAERLLEESLRSMGGGTGIDRHKMLRMIKEKLARDRKIVL